MAGISSVSGVAAAVGLALANVAGVAGGGPSGPSGPPNIAELYSTDIWSGNALVRDIPSGIDMSGSNEGLVWVKSQSAISNHQLVDTIRGISSILRTQDSAAETPGSTTTLREFKSTGYEIGASGEYNSLGRTYVGWSFKKAPRFFDVIKVTKNSTNQTFLHNLANDIGILAVKRLDAPSGWSVWHNTLAADEFLLLDTTAAKATSNTRWNNTLPTNLDITLGSDFPNGDYVIYLWAHDPADDGVIQCGEYRGNGNVVGPVITLGWRPQYVMIKRATGGTSSWHIRDVTRGINNHLLADQFGAEGTFAAINVTATGFNIITADDTTNASGSDYIYMAIREE